MRQTALVVLLASLLALAGPVHAITVDVPGFVFQPSVPFAVGGATPGASVNLTVGSTSREFSAVTSSDVFTLTGLASGWQPWAARIENGSSTDTFSGRVYIDGSITSLSASIANLLTEINALSTKLDNANATTVEGQDDLTALQGRMNVTVNQILDALLNATTGGANLEANVTEAMRRAARDVLNAQVPVTTTDLDQVSAAAGAAEARADSAASWALYATLAAAAAAFVAIAIGLLLFQQLQKTRGDFLVYVLALAAKSGITPESPEFQQALAATGHKPKEPKPKKEKKVKEKKAKK